MTIVKATQVYTNGDEHPLLLNLQYVVGISPGAVINGNPSTYMWGKGFTFYVKEDISFWQDYIEGLQNSQ